VIKKSVAILSVALPPGSARLTPPSPLRRRSGVGEPGQLLVQLEHRIGTRSWRAAGPWRSLDWSTSRAIEACRIEAREPASVRL